MVPWSIRRVFLLDYEEREYELMSNKSGIPVDAIDDAISAYDKVFPTEGGWFAEPDTVNVRPLKLFPGPLHGLGAN